MTTAKPTTTGNEHSIPENAANQTGTNAAKVSLSLSACFNQGSMSEILLDQDIANAELAPTQSRCSSLSLSSATASLTLSPPVLIQLSNSGVQMSVISV